MADTRHDRRTFLAVAGLGLPALVSARPGRRQAAPPASARRVAPAVMDEVAAHVSQIGIDRLPPEAIQEAKHHLLDTLAAMVAGSTLKAGRLSAQFASSEGGALEAHVVGSGARVSAITAALANGMMAHADETDDSHEASGTHPGCAVVPAALAAAEKAGADGATLLAAIVAGYDIGCRVNLALDRRLLSASDHSTHAIGGTFGAAAAAARALRLDRARVAFVMDYAGQQASGVRYWVRDSEHVEKAFVFGGMPARNGVTAALLASLGFSGVSDPFTGEGNFLDAFSTRPDPARLSEGLGRRFEILSTNIKKYPVGSPIQAPLDALSQLIARHRLTAREVARLDVLVPSKGTVDDRDMPDINLQYILAVTLVDGSLSFEAAHSYARMKDPAVLDVKKRIAVVERPELRTAESSRTGVVEVTTTDGHRYREQVTAVRGTAQNPMRPAEVEKKCAALLRPIVGEARSSALIESVRTLERVTDVRTLGPSLSAR